MVVSCRTETGDGSKGSGALYVSGFDGSFPYILAGEFVCTNPSYFLSKTPPSFAAVNQWSQMSLERAFCVNLE